MRSKAIAFLCLLALVMMIASEVTARELAETKEADTERLDGYGGASHHSDAMNKMLRFQSERRLEKNQPIYDEDDGNASPETRDNDDESGEGQKDATLGRDYVNVSSRPYLMKILSKQGDKNVLFADKILKFTGSGKMKRRLLLITDFAIYIVDPETYALKRRIALAAVEKLSLSELGDNFFAVIIPTEYDLLMASTRKKEIMNALLEATKSASDYELDVLHSNRFEYHAAAELVKEVQFEEVEGGVKARIVRK